MDRVKFITHKGKQILYIDYSGLKTSDQIVPVINELTTQVKKFTEKQLFLTDATDGSADKETMAQLKKVAKLCKELDIVEKECIVGVTGIKKILLSAVNAFARSNIVIFNTLEEAKDYLVKS